MADLSSRKVLMIATDGFEQDELFGPRQALVDAGVDVKLASMKTDPIQGVKHAEKAQTITPDMTFDDVHVEDYDALVLPGGVANPDALRMDDRAVDLVQQFVDADKIVAAICHAPWLLIEADVVDGIEMTSWPSLRTDLENAGADVVDEEVVIDGQFITSRKPDDVPAFSRAIIKALREQSAALAA